MWLVVQDAAERLYEEAKQCRASLAAAPEELQECFLGPQGTGAYARLDSLECPEASFMVSRTCRSLKSQRCAGCSSWLKPAWRKLGSWSARLGALEIDVFDS